MHKERLRREEEGEGKEKRREKREGRRGEKGNYIMEILFFLHGPRMRVNSCLCDEVTVALGTGSDGQDCSEGRGTS